MPSDMPRVTLRIEQEYIDKLKVIADENERSLNQEIVFTLKQRIKEYEEQKGRINTGKLSVSKIG
jgi:hypothetical protein